MYYIITKNQPYYSSLMSLSLLGLYPMSPDPMSAKISLAVTVGTIIFALIICNIGGIGHLIVSFKGSKGAEMSEDMAVAVGGLGFLMCASLFKRNGRKWTTFFSSITDFTTFGKPDEFDKIKDRCNLLSMMYSMYIGGGMCVYAATSVFEMQCDNDKNNNFCGTLTQISLPIDGAIPPLIIKAIFLFQLLVCIWACVGAGNLFFISLESTEFLICHMKGLKKKIIEIFHYEDETARKRALGVCVRYHNSIIDWGSDLDDLIKTTLGHMSLIAAIVIGMIGNQVVNKYKPLGAGIYLGGYVISIFCLSHAGQRIWDQSLSISDSIYESKWYDGSSEMMKDLTFMISKSQEPLVVSSLPLGTFNYALFVTMLKASYSYLTLLQQSTASEEEN